MRTHSYNLAFRGRRPQVSFKGMGGLGSASVVTADRRDKRIADTEHSDCSREP